MVIIKPSAHRTPRFDRPYLLLLMFYTGFLITIVILANLGIAKEAFSMATDAFGNDKFAHAFLMGTFSFLANSALRCRKTRLGRFSIMTGSLIVYILVLGEEISQIWQARRSPDPVDALFDIIGIFLFAGLAKLNCQLKQQH